MYSVPGRRPLSLTKPRVVVRRDFMEGLDA